MLFRQCLIRYMQPQSQERLQTLQLFRWRSLTLSTKHHRRSLLKRLAVRRMLYQSILMESWPESKSAEGKRCTINRDDCSLKRTDVQGWFKNLGKLYKEWAEDCVSAWRARHTELLKGATTDAFLISEPEISEGSYPGWGEKELDCCSVQSLWVAEVGVRILSGAIFLFPLFSLFFL